MGAISKIQWTDATWNPVRGCSRISEGCRNCYAERQAARFAGAGETDQSGEVVLSAGPFHTFAEMTPSGPRWTGKVELVESMLDAPLRWRKPRRVFVNSMSDLFHESLPDEVIDRVFSIMSGCRQHTFQILTKRAERMAKYMRRFKPDGRGWVTPGGEDAELTHCPVDAAWWPMRNVWLGVSVEDQQSADARIPHLLQTPAALRFVSYEPALGPVNFDSDEMEGLHALGCGDSDCKTRDKIPGCHGLDWLIVGGESGPNARPFDIAWARQIIAQCKAAGVPCLVKQLGACPWDSASSDIDHLFQACGHPCDCCDECPSNEGQRARKEHPQPLVLNDRKGGEPAEWPEDLRVREMPAC